MKKTSVPARDFGQFIFSDFEFIFSKIVFGIVVVVVFVTIFTGRRAGKRITFIHPVANNSTTRTSFILFYFIMMAGETQSFIFPTIFVNESVIINSQSIPSFAVEFTVVKKNVIFITVVIIHSMEHGVIYSVNRGDIKTDKSFMHFIIENVIEKCFRDLIIDIHFPRFQQLFFETRNEN